MPRIKKPVWIQATIDNVSVGDTVRIIPKEKGTEFNLGGYHEDFFYSAEWVVERIKEDTPHILLETNDKVRYQNWWVTFDEIEVLRRPYA